MKSKTRLVVIFMFLSLILFACNSKIAIEEEIKEEINTFYVESAEKILEEN